MYRSISVASFCVILIMLISACGGTKTESFSGVMSDFDFALGQNIPVDAAKVSASLPTMVSAGNTVTVKVKVTNDTPQAWSAFHVVFESSMVSTGDPYFEGFAVQSVIPAPLSEKSRFSPDGRYASFGFGQIGINETKEIEIQLQAVKPGGYGTEFTVGFWHDDESTNERNAIMWDTVLFTVIR